MRPGIEDAVDCEEDGVRDMRLGIGVSVDREADDEDPNTEDSSETGGVGNSLAPKPSGDEEPSRYEEPSRDEEPSGDGERRW